MRSGVRSRHLLVPAQWQSYVRRWSWRPHRCVCIRRYYYGSMKVKTSITLSEELLNEVDRAAGSESRSTFIEGVLRGFLRRRALNQEQDRDREILDRVAEALNEEAFDVLRYQTTWLEGVDEAPEGSEG